MGAETLFISDCHLDPARPQIGAALLDFLDGRAAGCSRLYILGDLFEVWLGDDDDCAALEPVIAALRELARARPVAFIAGNRDFLLGADFAARTGIELLREPVRLRLGQHRVALLHGDTLCTDDHDYQTFRARVRSPEWQAGFLAKPLDERRRIAAQLRADSGTAMAQKTEAIMDVNDDAVGACFRELDADTLIHGHTHRPAVHRYPGGLTRIVLGDWNPGPSYLSFSEARGFELIDPRVRELGA